MTLLKTDNNLIRDTLDKIKQVYKTYNLPFVIGYSGGKDSTLTTQLVFQALSELPRKDLKNDIYVITSDTLVETPPVINQITTNLKSIQKEAKKRGMPINTKLVRPLGSQTFWVNLIGRGYPSPNQTFRWCTDRMKIDPANRFIKDVVSEYGEVIMVLGVREGESNSRDRVLETHSVQGKELMKHTTLNNAFIFAPIKNFSVDDVWEYLLTEPSPWGADNQKLYELYANSNSSECPLVVDQETKQRAGSCGNSRLGCWTCTVVQKDKALTGFIESGEEWLRPLLQYRNWLTDIRDDRNMRMKRRTSGSIYFSRIQDKTDENENIFFVIPKKTKRDKLVINYNIDEEKYIDNLGKTWNIFNSEKEAKEYINSENINLSSDFDPRIIAKSHRGYFGQLGLGPFTMDARRTVLKKLLQTSKRLESEFELISTEELKKIRKIWIQLGDLEDSIQDIYFEVFNKHIDWQEDDQPLISKDDLEILRKLCEDQGVNFEIFKRTLNIEKKYYGNVFRRHAINEYSSLIKQDFLHIGE